MENRNVVSSALGVIHLMHKSHACFGLARSCVSTFRTYSQETQEAS
jgi:hypothetical protein